MPLLDALVEKHPGPWSTEDDWGRAVLAADGQRIHLFAPHEASLAEVLIEMAQTRRSILAKANAEVERILAESENAPEKSATRPKKRA